MTAPRAPTKPISSPPIITAMTVAQTGSVPRSKLARDAEVCFTAQFIPINANEVQRTERKSICNQLAESYAMAVFSASIGLDNNITRPEVETITIVRFTGE